MRTQVNYQVAWLRQLAEGLDAMQLHIDNGRQETLLGFLGLLEKWSRTYNLTAVRDPRQMVPKHLLDSLSILPWLERGPVLDVGTGAGLPGIPLAIARPELEFTLLDSNGKKARFVRQVVADLGLKNVEVVHARAEGLDRPAHYTCITARAVATLADVVSCTHSLLSPSGRWLVMKGARPNAEVAELPAKYTAEIETLTVPGEIGRRHLVVASRREAQA